MCLYWVYEGIFLKKILLLHLTDDVKIVIMC